MKQSSLLSCILGRTRIANDVKPSGVILRAVRYAVFNVTLEFCSHANRALRTRY